MQELELIAKTCNFEAATAEENKQQYVRDAFINGITSSSIRQRLLENTTLSLTQAFQQARTLEQAQKHSASYENDFVAAINTPPKNDDSPLQQDTLAAAPRRGLPNRDNSEKCYFCGKQRHPRNICPARNSECGKCKKMGHWARCCQSTPTPNTDRNISASVNEIPDLP